MVEPNIMLLIRARNQLQARVYGLLHATVMTCDNLKLHVITLFLLMSFGTISSIIKIIFTVCIAIVKACVIHHGDLPNKGSLRFTFRLGNARDNEHAIGRHPYIDEKFCSSWELKNQDPILQIYSAVLLSFTTTCVNTRDLLMFSNTIVRRGLEKLTVLFPH